MVEGFRGHRIRLEPGFHASRGSSFDVRIAPPDYLITLAPASANSDQTTAGNSATYTVTVTGIYGFGAAVSFSAGNVTGLPSGATASFSTSPVTPPVNRSASTTLTIHTAAGITGNYGFTVTGTATGYASHVGTGLVSILPAPPSVTGIGSGATVIDAAGNWKQSSYDAFGNLITVTEPNPAGGTFTTNYTYNGANQLTQVTMTRNGVTQNRTFTWSGTDLVSATNPENGTVNYTYDGAHHVTQRTDAKGQVTQYSYDSYGRLTLVNHYPQGTSYPADPNQQVNYSYDTNPYNDSISTYTWGRLAAVAFGSSCPGNTGYVYMYGYNPAGRVTGQKMRVTINDPVPGNQSCVNYTAPDQTATYGWDTEGRMTSLSYPGATNGLTYTYDAMGHVNGMSDSVTGASASAAYGMAGEIDSLSYRNGGNYFSQNFSYNTLWQMTGDGVMSYIYTAGHNNGRVSQTFDGAQTVNYGYDTLNRLSSARAADNSWGNVYGYDGFGNLTAKAVAPGAATGMQFSAAYDANNHQAGYGVDANGNMLTGAYDAVNQQYLQYQYDVENRIVTASDSYVVYGYGYDPQGKRVLRQTAVQGQPNPTYNDEFTFDGVTGQRLSTFNVVFSWYQNSGYCNGARYCANGPAGGYVYFGGRLILQGGAGSVVVTDRLGSQRAGMSYYPWGEEKTTTADGQVKFGTYFRDMAGQDYADQRYYTASAGRFWTVDPVGMRAVNLRNPISWNMYAYANDDPVNFYDPHGAELCLASPDGGCNDFGGDGGFGGMFSSLEIIPVDLSLVAGPVDIASDPTVNNVLPNPTFSTTTFGLSDISPVPSPVSTTLDPPTGFGVGITGRGRWRGWCWLHWCRCSGHPWRRAVH